ncbi:MAG TPA: TonB-dependent receptor plug domain-containing protein, partial [Pyrinomonadaceae bacterium]|nr:TonB-dependent receptor plug domain-containing protein [Pyrinomonadaceae bacterium]
MDLRIVLALFLLFLLVMGAVAQGERRLNGTVVTPQFQLVPGVEIEVRTASGSISGKSDSEGHFSIAIPEGDVTAVFTGKNISPVTLSLSSADATSGIQVKINYLVPPISENVTITDDSLTPQIEFRNDALYKNTLFGRDDQLIQTLNAGINAGQHEGGGKSLEIRRYGFNLDHGGVNGGLKIVVDNIQQNQGTQGHGQGYLGALKSVSPELVEDVSIINGPFSAVYGDFSGLGVVQIRQKESLPQTFTARL